MRAQNKAAMSMLGVLAKFGQRALRPAPTPESGLPHDPEQAGAALALSRELLHSVEQFVLSTPDLDTSRFLHRVRGTAAGLQASCDAPTIRLYQEWVSKALGVFANLQRSYIAEREAEMWRLLETYQKSFNYGEGSSNRLIETVRDSHERMRQLTRLEDLRSAREQIQEEIQQAQRAVAQKAQEDKERIAALGREVARLEAALAAVRGQANFDVLTGVYHRGVFLERVNTLLAEGKPCSLAFMDIDNFKTINDTLGHAVGDRILVVVSDQLKRVARTTDLAARYGGDEFCFLAAGATTEHLAQRIAGAVSRRHVRLEMEDRACSVLLSMSVGIAAAKPGEPADAFLNRADRALLAAKREGKGGVRVAISD